MEVRLSERLKLAAQGLCRAIAQGRREGWDALTMRKLTVRLSYVSDARASYGRYLRQHPEASPYERLEAARDLGIPMTVAGINRAIRQIEERVEAGLE